MEIILTIVIPSYNTSKYMTKVLPTILAEEVLDCIEVLIINDGSEDNTLELAKTFEAYYPNTIRVIDKANGGHGSVINKGILEARGKYFKVIDGDDFVDSEALIQLVKLLKNQNADVVLSDYNTISDKSGQIVRHTPFRKGANSFVKYNIRYELDVILREIYASIHSITYKTQVLKDNYENIIVLEHVFYDDMEYSTYAIMFCSSILLNNNCVYQYVIDQENQSMATVVHRRRLSHSIAGVNAMVDRLLKWETILSREKKQYMQYIIDLRVKGIFNLCLTTPGEQKEYKDLLKKFDKELKKKSLTIYRYTNHTPVIRILRFTRFHLFYAINSVSKRNC